MSVRSAVQSFWTVSTTTLYTLILGIPVILVALVSRTGRAPYRLGRIWSWLILRTNRVKLVIMGLDKIVRDRSYVFISNHMSQLDPVAIATKIQNPIRFVAKKSLAKIPIFGLAARLAKMIFIDRKDSSRAIAEINRYLADIKNGISALFFAEGSRGTDGTMRPFKKGGIIFALKGKLPIVPITIINSDRLLPRGQFWIKSGVIRIIIGDPIDTSQFSEGSRDELLVKVQSVIRDNIRGHGRLTRFETNRAVGP